MVLHTGIHCFRETDWKRIDIAACRQQRNKDTDTGKHNAFTCMRMSCICPNALIWKGIENKVLQPGSLLKREKKNKKKTPAHPKINSMALYICMQTCTPALPISLQMLALHLPHDWRAEPAASKPSLAKFCTQTEKY